MDLLVKKIIREFGSGIDYIDYRTIHWLISCHVSKKN